VITAGNISYVYSEKELEYSKPTFNLSNIQTMFAGFDLKAKKLSYVGEKCMIENGTIRDENQYLDIDFNSINAELNFEKFQSTKSITTIGINAKSIVVEEKAFEEKVIFDAEINIGRLNLNSNRLNLVSSGKNIAELTKFNTNINQIIVKQKNVKYGDIKILANGMTYFDSEDYMVKSGALEIGMNNISFKNLQLKSIRALEDLVTKKQKTNTIYDVRIAKVDIIGNNISDIQSLEQFVFNQLDVAGVNLEIYTDNNVSVEKAPEKVISQMIKEIDIPFYIKRVNILNSNVDFKLKAKRRKDFGNLYFKFMNGTVDHFTNMPLKIEQNPWMKTKFTGLLMGNAPFVINLDYNMLDKQNTYAYSGNIKSVHFEDVNRMLEDLSAIRVKKGTFDELVFNMESNKYKTEGDLAFYYKNLKIRHVEERTTGIPDPLRLLVNGLVLRQNNIKGRSPKLASVSLSHPAEHSNFRCIWETIYQGIEISLLPKIPKPLKRFGN
jgi:hypothetical protein